MVGLTITACTTETPFTSGRDGGGAVSEDRPDAASTPMDVVLRRDAGEVAATDTGADVPVTADVPEDGMPSAPDILVAQTCERPNHNACSSDGQCCPGVPCTTGAHRQDCCKPVGWACGNDDECCGRHCEGGVCACSRPMPGSTYTCIQDSDCCDDFGCSDFTERCCVRTGRSCSAASDCCIRACYDGVCCKKRDDGVCSSDAECCSGLTCNSPGPGASRTCCNLGGGRCAGDRDCCGSLSCSGGRCCAGDFGSCRTNADCCNNSCSAGQCTCIAAGGACSSGSSCCGGSCEGGRCCSNPTGSCRDDRDCCGMGSVCVGSTCCRAVGGACRSGLDCCSSRCDVDHCVL